MATWYQRFYHFSLLLTSKIGLCHAIYQVLSLAPTVVTHTCASLIWTTTVSYSSDKIVQWETNWESPIFKKFDVPSNQILKFTRYSLFSLDVENLNQDIESKRIFWTSRSRSETETCCSASATSSAPPDALIRHNGEWPRKERHSGSSGSN